MDRELFSALKANAAVEFDVPMSKYTSFRIGGPASCMVTPHDEDALVSSLSLAKENDIAVFILGSGTNLLVSDEGFSGLVINMTGGIPVIKRVSDNEIEASAGAALSRIAVFAMNESLSGLEFASGIPGSLGGAVYMNAGAYGGEMRDVVTLTRFVTLDGAFATCEGVAHGFDYRRSAFTDSDRVILSSRLKLKAGITKEIADAMRDIRIKRADKQPLSYPSAGSTFKRPVGDFAGRLIEASGLKGYSIGGAQVSEKHAGFIVNTGNATASDVYSLIMHIKDEVYRKHNVMLESEVKLVGRF